jgi:hypothetical protein
MWEHNSPLNVSFGSCFDAGVKGPFSNVPLSGGTPMKRISILLVVLLALPAFSHADTIKLTSGSGTMAAFQEAPGFTFQFHGGGYDISIPGALDDPGGTLWNCHDCDPTHLSALPLFLFVGDLTFGDQLYSGEIRFDAVSFVSSIAPSGILTVKYSATAFIQLSLVDRITREIVVGPFVWGNPNQLWEITAQFSPDAPAYFREGGTTFTSMTPVPEPATIALVGTGILPVLFAVRSRCKSNTLKTV